MPSNQKMKAKSSVGSVGSINVAPVKVRVLDDDPDDRMKEEGRDSPLNMLLIDIQGNTNVLHARLTKLFNVLQPYVAEAHFQDDDKEGIAVGGQPQSADSTPTYNRLSTANDCVLRAVERLEWITAQIQH